MKAIWLISGVLCLCAAQLLFAQSAFFSPAEVSLYQLSFKPDKQARRLFAKGASELKRQDFQASIKLFEKAVEVDPHYWAAQNNLGYAYLKIAQPERARQAFERAVAIDPKNPIGYANLSVVALNFNDYRLAEKLARQALGLNPALREAKGLLGVAEAGQGNWTPEAHRLLEEGWQYFPGSERLLRKWPSAHSAGPSIVVVQGGVR